VSAIDLSEAWNTWRATRLTSVTSASGNLALIQTTWFEDDERYEPARLLAGQPDSVNITELIRSDFAGNVVATGYRLWDAQSPAILAFQGIESYEFDPNWLIKGAFKEFPVNTPIPFEYLRDNGGTRDLAVPGEIEVVIAGETYHLNAFDDDGKLLLVFGDLTNRTETYGSGRFLFVDRNTGTDEVILDFNRAFIPPCGFSIHYNCPMPPIQNRIKVAIRAGEKNPVFSSSYVH
jgi:uncharacterized protein (DUF1684 family)